MKQKYHLLTQLVISSSLVLGINVLVLDRFDARVHPNMRFTTVIADSITSPLPYHVSKSVQNPYITEMRESHRQIMAGLDRLEDYLKTMELTIPGALELGKLSITKEQAEEILNNSINTNYKIDNTFELDTRG